MQGTLTVKVPDGARKALFQKKRSALKAIQKKTNTLIETPERDQEPIFKISGLAMDINAARIEIEALVGPVTVVHSNDSISGNDDIPYGISGMFS